MVEEEKDKDEGRTANESTWKLVCQEIRDTEKAFAGHLDTLLADFLPAISAVVDKAEDLRTLFGNVRQLHEFSLVFQADLDAALESDEVAHAIAGLYQTTAPFFRLYSTYCQTHGEAQELVARMLRSKDFRTVVDDCEKKGGQSLLSLLIMPIQRVPRHVLLLRTLRDALPPAHQDHAACQAALIKMQETAATINESIRERENAVKIWEIQHSLVQDSILFETHRVFKMEGELLMVCGRKHKKKRKCFLFNDCLVVAKSSGLKRKKWQLVEKVAAQQVQDLADDSALTLGASNALLVGCGEDHSALVLIADTAESKAHWLGALRQVVPQGPPKSSARSPVYASPARQSVVCQESELVDHQSNRPFIAASPPRGSHIAWVEIQPLLMVSLVRLRQCFFLGLAQARQLPVHASAFRRFVRDKHADAQGVLQDLRRRSPKQLAQAIGRWLLASGTRQGQALVTGLAAFQWRQLGQILLVLLAFLRKALVDQVECARQLAHARHQPKL